MPRRLLFLAVPTVAVAAWGFWPLGSGPAPSPILAADYDVKASRPERIAPGTVVGKTAPEGWSHLVLKSLPRVRASEKEKVSDLTARMAGWMLTVLAVDVARSADNPPKFHFRTVGLGLGTTIKGRDTVITPDTGKKFGADMGWISRTILEKGYETQDTAVLVVKGPTMGILDTPVWYKWDGKHTLVRYRYVFLVDESTGRLDVVLWPLGPGGKLADPPLAVQIANNTVDEVELVPDLKEFNLLGVPSDAGFAVDRLPVHTGKFEIPKDLLSLASATKFTAEEAQKLEVGLRALVAKP